MIALFASTLRDLGVLLAMTCLASAAAAQCVGDCNGDGRVAVGELIVGVNIALGERALGDCPGFDRNRNGRIEIGELLTAVNAALAACPTPAATATATPSPTPNLPPQAQSLPVYRGYPGLAIDLPLPVTDPEGAELSCEAENLPDGAVIDAASDSLRWTPDESQLGPFYVPFACSDPGIPPLSAAGELILHVAPPDPCAILDCDPASGCTTALPGTDTACCTTVPEVRVAEPDVDCPEGRVLFIGRNVEPDNPIGRLQNCDYMRMFVVSQTGASLRFNAEIRCMRTATPFALRVRVENPSRGVVLDYDTGDSSPYFFRRGENGYFERRALVVPIPNDPYFDLEDSEANVHVTLTDADGVSVSQSLRVILTSTPLPDLIWPEPTPTASR